MFDTVNFTSYTRFVPRAALTADQIAWFRARAVVAAARLFAEQGYDAVGMRAVADALGVSAMTPYRYFANKDELFAAVRADAFRRFADAQQVAYEAHVEPRPRLLALGRAYVAFALAEPDAYRVMFELAQAPAGTYPDLDAQSRRAFSYLLRATEAVVPRDALSAAHLAWAQVHGLVTLHLAGKLQMGRSLDALLAAAFEERFT